MRDSMPRVAVVDYGVGNLFSVAQACMAAGLRPIVTSDPDVLRRSDGIILPGIGAFGDAMAALAGLNLVEPLRRVPAEGIPLIGICLGMQLLMDRSSEFGSHEGLGLVPGSVERLATEAGIKVPQVGEQHPSARSRIRRRCMGGVAAAWAGRWGTGVFRTFVRRHSGARKRRARRIGLWRRTVLFGADGGRHRGLSVPP